MNAGLSDRRDASARPSVPRPLLDSDNIGSQVSRKKIIERVQARLLRAEVGGEMMSTLYCISLRSHGMMARDKIGGETTMKVKI